jgi:SAM-dependent MidA family methyltransferase
VLSAADHLRSAIAEAGGAIPFERFMELALYGNDGFYTTAGRAGRRGDFITSPEVGPLFGAVVARALDVWWEELGRPSTFTVVDAGAGPGTLARAVLAARPRCLEALDYVAVEVSDAQRERHPNGVRSTADVPDVPITGVIIANELLDNLPFRLAVFDGGWREALVTVDGDRFVEILGARIDHPLLPTDAPHGARAPLQVRASSWVRNRLRSLHAGRLVVIDYSVPSTASLARRPWREWLRTYRGHERGEHYLRSPGTQDITTDIAVDQLVLAAGAPAWVGTQAEALRAWGIDDLVEEGRSHWRDLTGAPDLTAMRMRSRVSESEALLDPSGLGRFGVAVWNAPAEPPVDARGRVPGSGVQ